MEKQTRPIYTKREKLSGGPAHRPRISINMEDVYNDLNHHMTVREAADKYKVSESTLRRRHKEYQAFVKSLLEEPAENSAYELPPLPTDL